MAGGLLHTGHITEFSPFLTDGETEAQKMGHHMWGTHEGQRRQGLWICPSDDLEKKTAPSVRNHVGGKGQHTKALSLHLLELPGPGPEAPPQDPGRSGIPRVVELCYGINVPSAAQDIPKDSPPECDPHSASQSWPGLGDCRAGGGV